MRVEFYGLPWPRWTVHAVYPFSTTIRYEYAADGHDVVVEQYFESSRFGLVRRCSWSDAGDRAVLRRDAAAGGVDLKRVQDLVALPGLNIWPRFVLHGADAADGSVAVILHDLGGGLDPNDEPDLDFDGPVTNADEKLDEIAEIYTQREWPSPAM